MALDFNLGKKTVVIAISFVLLAAINISLLVTNVLKVNSEASQNESDVLCIPAACNQPGQYIPDFNCIQKQISDPRAKEQGNPEFCCANKCRDESLNTGGTAQPEVFRRVASFFGGDII